MLHSVHLSEFWKRSFLRALSLYANLYMEYVLVPIDSMYMTYFDVGQWLLLLVAFVLRLTWQWCHVEDVGLILIESRCCLFCILVMTYCNRWSWHGNDAVLTRVHFDLAMDYFYSIFNWTVARKLRECSRPMIYRNAFCNIINFLHARMPFYLIDTLTAHY